MLEEKRFERKWIFRSNNYLNLINSLLRSKLFFRFNILQEKVNSIYFDDNSYSSIIENLDGINEKTKLRLRWYGERSIIKSPFFESKKKIGFIAKKKHVKVDNLNNLIFPETLNLKKINKDINQNNFIKKKVSSIISTHYDREYLISADNPIRATVDYNLKSINLKNLSQLKLIKNFSEMIILEIKYPINLDTLLRKKLKDIIFDYRKTLNMLTQFLRFHHT